MFEYLSSDMFVLQRVVILWATIAPCWDKSLQALDLPKKGQYLIWIFCKGEIFLLYPVINMTGFSLGHVSGGKISKFFLVMNSFLPGPVYHLGIIVSGWSNGTRLFELLVNILIQIGVSWFLKIENIQ